MKFVQAIGAVRRRLSAAWARIVLALLMATSLLASGSFSIAQAHDDEENVGRYRQENLVSDLPGLAAHTDPRLINPWGISFSATSPFWISDNGAGVSTLYDGAGQPLPLVVTVPAPSAGSSTPTGQVFNSTTSDFAVSNGVTRAKSLFIFATEDGTISGWNPTVDPSRAILAVDNSKSRAVYKGLALGGTAAGNFLYAANFRAGTIDVFDGAFHQVEWAGAFRDTRIAAGYAPFNVQNLGGQLFVTYALQNADKHDDVAGPAHGFVDVFTTGGALVRRFARHGTLNSPWGLTLDQTGREVFVGNFGDGRINVFDRIRGEFLGQLRDADNHKLTISGLWALTFGNGGRGGAVDKLYFTAGIDDEAHGLFGSLTKVPSDDGLDD